MDIGFTIQVMVVVMCLLAPNTDQYHTIKFEVPYENGYCFEAGNKILQEISEYHETYKGEAYNQGWYTNAGNLVFGWYCE